MLLGEQTPIGFFFQATVLGQPLLWMWIHDNDWRIKESYKSLFYLIAGFFIFAVGVTGFQIGFYHNHLIIQYAILTMIAVYLYNVRNSIKEAICLGFLTVFLNSFYWEIPFHLAELLSGSLHVGMLVQLWRTVPLIFFVSHYEFNAKTRAIVSLGMGFSGIVMVSKCLLHLKLNYFLLFALNRFVCLLLLIKVIVEAEPNQKVKNT